MLLNLLLCTVFSRLLGFGGIDAGTEKVAKLVLQYIYFWSF